MPSTSVSTMVSFRRCTTQISLFQIGTMCERKSSSKLQPHVKISIETHFTVLVWKYCLFRGRSPEEGSLRPPWWLKNTEHQTIYHKCVWEFWMRVSRYQVAWFGWASTLIDVPFSEAPHSIIFFRINSSLRSTPWIPSILCMRSSISSSFRISSPSLSQVKMTKQDSPNWWCRNGVGKKTTTAETQNQNYTWASRCEIWLRRTAWKKLTWNKILQDLPLKILLHFSINSLGFLQLIFKFVQRRTLHTLNGIQLILLRLEALIVKEKGKYIRLDSEYERLSVVAFKHQNLLGDSCIEFLKLSLKPLILAFQVFNFFFHF